MALCSRSYFPLRCSLLPWRRGRKDVYKRQKKYIGRVANIADAEGTATFSLPADAATSEYRLFVWNEYEDSDTK